MPSEVSTTMPHPLADQLKHKAFPHLARALRTRAIAIADSWMEVVREVMPQMDRLTVAEMRNHIPEVLDAIAAALDSSNRDDLNGLLAEAANHGLARYLTDQSLLDLFEEQRLLRGAIVVEIEKQLDDQIQVAESAALHATIDIMLQQSILAMVEKQNEQLRAAAEAEVKFMAFLGHDLNNNLFLVNAALDHIKRQITNLRECQVSLDSLNTAQQAIQKTVHGMKRLLERERLRKSGVKPTFKKLNLLDTASSIARQFRDEARKKGLQIEVKSQPPPEQATVDTDEELIALVLQNLVHNAVKYSDRGTIEIAINHIQPAPQENQPNCWQITVADQGPGIEPQQRQRIFEAFKRGDSFGHEGIGLGLVIASQAAALLNAQLHLESKQGPGGGSKFSLSLPVEQP